MINTHNGIKGKIPRIDIEQYPAVKAHLDKYWAKIKKRADQGDTPYNLRNCAYMEEFDKPKLIYPDICSELTFILDEERYLLNNTSYFITSKEESILTHLSEILNSKLINWYYRTLSVQLGEKAIRMFSIYVLQIPIPKMSNEDIYTLFKLTKAERDFILDN